MKKTLLYKHTVLVLLCAIMLVSASCSNEKTVNEPAVEGDSTGSAPSAQQTPEDEQSDETNGVDAHTETIVTEFRAEYPDRSLREVANGSELIIRAKLSDVLDARYKNDESSIIVTHYEFEVLESYKGGKKAGDTVTVESVGGTIGNRCMTVPDFPGFSNNQELIMMLSYPTDENDEIISTEYYVYYPIRGILYEDTNTADAQSINGSADKVFTAVDSNCSIKLSEAKTDIAALLTELK